MAFGIGEPPERSPGSIIHAVDYPVTPAELAETAADAGSPAHTIAFLRSLPRDSYESADEVMRDFAEADARFGLGGRGTVGRGDLGKQLTEPPGEPANEP